MLSSASLEPARRAQSATRTRAPPTTPHSGSRKAGTRSSSRDGTPRSQRGLTHSVPSATKETTRTIAAAHANSQRGIGRSCLPTRPWASAVVGSPAATASRPVQARATRRRNRLAAIGGVWGRRDIELLTATGSRAAYGRRGRRVSGASDGGGASRAGRAAHDPSGAQEQGARRTLRRRAPALRDAPSHKRARPRPLADGDDLRLADVAASQQQRREDDERHEVQQRVQHAAKASRPALYPVTM